MSLRAKAISRWHLICICSFFFFFFSHSSQEHLSRVMYICIQRTVNQGAEGQHVSPHWVHLTRPPLPAFYLHATLVDEDKSAICMKNLNKVASGRWDAASCIVSPAVPWDESGPRCIFFNLKRKSGRKLWNKKKVSSCLSHPSCSHIVLSFFPRVFPQRTLPH